MVFSKECYPDRMGKGWVLPIKAEVDFDGMKREAKAMGGVEGFKHSYCDNWGCVAMLFNLNRPNGEMMKSWAEFMSPKIPKALLKAYLKTEEPAVDVNGFLTIGWPREVAGTEGLDKIDFLIATVTQPRDDGKYPTPHEIAKAMNRIKNNDYFKCNRKHGITTFQDEEIERLITP